MDLTGHLDYLRSLGADEVPHSAGSILEHFWGTAMILKGWGQDLPLCLAGLYHSVYNQRFFKAPPSRAELTEHIGAHAEAIVFTFGLVSRGSKTYANLASEEGTDQAQLYRQAIVLLLANNLEQVGRCPMSGAEVAQDLELLLLSRSFVPQAAVDDYLAIFESAFEAGAS